MLFSVLDDWKCVRKWAIQTSYGVYAAQLSLLQNDKQYFRVLNETNTVGQIMFYSSVLVDMFESLIFGANQSLFGLQCEQIFVVCL